MKKKFVINYIGILGIIITCIFTSYTILIKAENNFSSGSGTSTDPYIISNVQDFEKLNDYCGEDYKDTYFKLETNSKTLDMEQKRIEPICSLSEGTNEEEVFKNAFYGHFDGNNVEINNLTIETNGISGGLFGATYNAIIENIGMGENTKVLTHGKVEDSGISPTGGIVGEAWNTKLSNVWNKGTIKGDFGHVGGIVGRLIQNSVIINAYNEGNISAGITNNNTSDVGGIAGYASDIITIENVYNKGNILGEGKRVGGIVGTIQGYLPNRNTEGTSIIKNAYNIGSIETKGDSGYIGGISGIATMTYIENVVNYTTDIKSPLDSKIGLIIGHINDSEKYSETTVKNAYTIKENTDLNGIGSSSINKYKSENVKGYNLEELKNQESYIGFDFDNIWVMNDEHAILKFNNSTSNNDSTQKSDITIKYNEDTINVENFLYNNGRVYVDLFSFCKESNLCTIDSGTKDNKYIIDKNMEITGDISTSDNGENIKYTYRVEHEKGTKLFTPSIIIGGRIIDNDVARQEGDVASCPSDDETLKCSEDKLFVPIRFLTQSLGLRVEWDGENQIVNIKNNFVETFLSKYDVVTTTNQECNDSSCIIEKDENITHIEKGNTYYLNVLNKENNNRMEYYKVYSFYDSIKNIGSIDDPKFKNGIFSLNKGTMTISEDIENHQVFERNIAQIIIYEIQTTDVGYQESDYNIGGYPIVINGIFKCTNCT